MSGQPLPIGSTEPWTSGPVSESATCLLAPNASPMTLDGTNTWVLAVPGAATAVLVDPGPRDRAHLAAIQDHLDRNDLRITEILLTHGHADHSEGAGMFSTALGAPVRALDPAHTLGAEGLVPGDVVEIADLRIDVVATPGHSSDSLSFHVRDLDLVLTGDTILGRGTTVVAWPDGDLGDYMASLVRLQNLLADLDDPRLLPGHGPSVDEPHQLIERYLIHRAQRLDQVRTAMLNGARTPEDVVQTVYQPIPDALIPAALASVGAQWDYLTTSGLT